MIKDPWSPWVSASFCTLGRGQRDTRISIMYNGRVQYSHWQLACPASFSTLSANIPHPPSLVDLHVSWSNHAISLPLCTHIWPSWSFMSTSSLSTEIGPKVGTSTKRVKSESYSEVHGTRIRNSGKETAAFYSLFSKPAGKEPRTCGCHVPA